MKALNTENICLIQGPPGTGKVAGKNERNIEIAQKMLKKSMKIEDIIELTGLSQEEIEKLK